MKLIDCWVKDLKYNCDRSWDRKSTDFFWGGGGCYFSVMCELCRCYFNEDFHPSVNEYHFVTFLDSKKIRRTGVNCRGCIALSADLAFLGHLACLSAKLLHGSAEGSCGGHSGECNVADFAKGWEFGLVRFLSSKLAKKDFIQFCLRFLSFE